MIAHSARACRRERCGGLRDVNSRVTDDATSCIWAPRGHVGRGRREGGGRTGRRSDRACGQAAASVEASSSARSPCRAAGARLRARARRRGGRSRRGEAESLPPGLTRGWSQNLADDGAVGDEREDGHAAATSLALEDVGLVDALEVGPGDALEVGPGDALEVGPGDARRRGSFSLVQRTLEATAACRGTTKTEPTAGSSTAAPSAWSSNSRALACASRGRTNLANTFRVRAAVGRCCSTESHAPIQASWSRTSTTRSAMAGAHSVAPRSSELASESQRALSTSRRA